MYALLRAYRLFGRGGAGILRDNYYRAAHPTRQAKRQRRSRQKGSSDQSDFFSRIKTEFDDRHCNERLNQSDFFSRIKTEFDDGIDDGIAIDDDDGIAIDDGITIDVRHSMMASPLMFSPSTLL
jgi:hypothetical protein